MFEKIKNGIKNSINKNTFHNKNNEQKEKQINKENSMPKTSTYGNAEKIDYTKVQQAFNKANKKSNDINMIISLKANLDNFSKDFNNLEDDKKQSELKSDKFKKLSKDLKGLNKEDINKIVAEMESQIKVSNAEELIKEIKNIVRIEIKEQEKNLFNIINSTDKIDNISKIINESFWNKLKQSIPVPKFDLTPIIQKIDSIKNDLKQNKNDINNSNRELAKRIDNIKIPSFPTFPKIPNDYLKKDDFEFTINDKLKDLKGIKESSEDLEAIPAKVIDIDKKIDALSEKMDNLPSSNASKSSKYIPKEEKSVIELAKYMTDGVAQFENIAKEYISKISELDKLDKIKKNHQDELKQAKRDEFKNGEKAGKIELIKTLAENFPTEFKTIQSTFEDLLEEKIKKDEVLEINDDNRNEMLPFIEDKIENGKYTVLSPAILVDSKILFKATVEKVDVEKADV